MKYEILNDAGKVENTIVADAAFVEQHYAGRYRAIDDSAERAAEAAREARERRGQLLAASDWTQVADAPVDKAAWAAYRQALRDVPGQQGFPLDISWPDKP